MVNIWEEIEKQPKDLWFFYLFLLTFTLGVRKVLLFLPIKGIFNEYAGVYVYASDIFVCLAIVAWLVFILYNKIVNQSMSSDDSLNLIHKINCTKSVDKSPAHKLSTGNEGYLKALFERATKMFHLTRRQAGVEHLEEQNYSKCSTWNIFCFSSVFLIPLLLVFWSFVSVLWSENQTIGVYRALRFPELYLLYIYVAARFVPYCLAFSKNCSTWNIFLHSSRIVPRGTILDKTNSDSVELFHVEQFEYILSKMTQYFRAILLGLVVIALFDHYLWDIWQGQVLLWLVGGVLAGIELSESSHLKDCSTWNNLGSASSKIVPRGTIYAGHLFLGIIMLLGVIQSLIGIAQFVVQHSLGLFLLKESLVGQGISGVAKIIANHHSLIRAYGLFPHPNLLGGFLFFSIIVTMLYKKMFHVEHSVGDVEQLEHDQLENCSTWNNLGVSNQSGQIVPRGTIGSFLGVKMLNLCNIINLILLIQIFGILLSFSKAAILALVVALVYINVPSRKFQKCFTWNIFGSLGRRGMSKSNGLDSKKSGESDFANCSTWNNFGNKISKLFHVEHFKSGLTKFALVIGFLLIALVDLVYFKFDFKAFFMKSLGERNLYLSISDRIISDNSIIGIGTGQFIFEAERLFPNLEIWQYQPVHNVFLLIWSEWGIVGLVLFILFLWKLFRANVPRGTILQKASSPYGRGCPKDR